MTKHHPINLSRIEYFLVFCDSMQFTSAARTLGISQPALTKAINKLESDMGTRLIRREGKHTHLTKHGKEIQAKLSFLMEHVNGVENDISKIVDRKEEVLRLAVARSMDFYKIAKFLGEFYTVNPNAHIDIVDCQNNQCWELLHSGEVEILFSFECEEIKHRCQCIELYEEFLGVTNTEIKDASKAVLTELAENNSITADSDDLGTKIFDTNNQTNSCLINCTQQLWVQQLIKAGVGVGISAIRSETIEGINITSNNQLNQTRQVSAAIPAGRNDSEIFDRFVDFLKKYNWQ